MNGIKIITIDVVEPSSEEYEKMYDTVAFFCPKCKSMLQVSYHFASSCLCGMRWQTPAPICVNADIKPIMEINGVETK